jgi:puromycin-sensitive aminopeptidase
MNPKAYRLPTHVLPGRYDVQIDARPGREDFHGQVNIALEVVESRDAIEIHARELVLDRAELTAGGKELKGEIEQDAVREMAAIRFGEPLPVGEATLEIGFTGRVSKSMEGLYLAKDGPEQCLSTQCEETFARMIFPCFDEPEFKAQFAWEVTTGPGATVLANGPLLSVEDSDDWGSKTWKFAVTKPMSSYLVAVVIGDVAGTPEEVVNGTPIRVWAIRGKEKMGEYAHRYTARLLPWFEGYFDVPYHFDKYDQAAVPGFAGGAMENTGLVLFRQDRLLMNPATASWEQEKVIAKVVAHEFAHMWFGNLVTMRWWDDLWLNEAFAEWLANKVVDEISPEYRAWHDFTAGKGRGKGSALQADSLENTHPIYSPVETPADATELFDVITYEKGCSVMRMLENFLGADAFRAGLRTYMREFSEGNAAGADLWRHLQNASDHPVAAIMESWITQPGYPVVRVSLEASGQDTRLRLGQQRYFSSPGISSEQVWQIPLVIRYEDGAGTHEARYLLAEREATLPVDVSGEVRWCYANADEIGFYRQDPEGDLLKGLLANLDGLTPVEQAGLVSDQHALVRNGTRPMTAFLDTLAATTTLTDYGVVETVVNHLHTLNRLLEDAGDEAALRGFREWIVRSFRGQLDELGFEPREGEARNDTQRRVSLVEAVAYLGRDERAIEESVRYAGREAADPGSVDPNLAPLFVRIAARSGDRKRMEEFVRLYEGRKAAGASPQERNRYLYSFAEFEAPELVERTLQLIDEKVIPQESVGQMLAQGPMQLLARKRAQMQAWEYVRKNWKTLRTNLGVTWIGRLVEASSQLPIDRREEMVAFFDANLNGEARQSYARALELQSQLAEFKARTREDLVSWFGGR